MLLSYREDPAGSQLWLDNLALGRARDVSPLGRPTAGVPAAHDMSADPGRHESFQETSLSPIFEQAVHAQIDAATESKGPGTLESLIYGGETWTVG